jgi:hypothetical protein
MSGLEVLWIVFTFIGFAAMMNGDDEGAVLFGICISLILLYFFWWFILPVAAVGGFIYVMLPSSRHAMKLAWIDMKISREMAK